MKNVYQSLQMFFKIQAVSKKEKKLLTPKWEFSIKSCHKFQNKLKAAKKQKQSFICIEVDVRG